MSEQEDRGVAMNREYIPGVLRPDISADEVSQDEESDGKEQHVSNSANDDSASEQSAIEIDEDQDQDENQDEENGDDYSDSDDDDILACEEATVEEKAVMLNTALIDLAQNDSEELKKFSNYAIWNGEKINVRKFFKMMTGLKKGCNGGSFLKTSNQNGRLQSIKSRTKVKEDIEENLRTTISSSRDRTHILCPGSVVVHGFEEDTNKSGGKRYVIHVGKILKMKTKKGTKFYNNKFGIPLSETREGYDKVMILAWWLKKDGTNQLKFHYGQYENVDYTLESFLGVVQLTYNADENAWYMEENDRQKFQRLANEMDHNKQKVKQKKLKQKQRKEENSGCDPKFTYLSVKPKYKIKTRREIPIDAPKEWVYKNNMKCKCNDDMEKAGYSNCSLRCSECATLYKRGDGFLLCKSGSVDQDHTILCGTCYEIM